VPGLIRAATRTAVIAGTATAVAGRVQRRQASRFADRDAQLAVQQQNAYEQAAGAQQAGYAQPAPEPAYYQPAPAAAAVSQEDRLSQLKQLGDLKAQGILTEEEFQAEKAKILAS
jgi:Short C-terminal domain